MKKKIFSSIAVISAIFATLLGSSCSTTGMLFSNEKIEVPFNGTIDSRFGYEAFSWGMTVDECKKVEGYPFIYIYNYWQGKDNYFPRYGYVDSYNGNTNNRYYAHGNVEQTKFTCFGDRIYSVTDTLKIKNPSFEYLHERYGDFSEVNLADKIKHIRGYESIVGFYNNIDYTNAGSSSLAILIYKNGVTEVIVTDPVLYASVRTAEMAAKSEFPANQWQIFGYTDSKEKSYNYIFLTQNENKDKVIFYYKKNPENPVLSSLTAGFSPKQTYGSGKYEIKTKNGLIEKNYSSEVSIKLNVLDIRYIITHNNSESAREILNLVRENESVTIRKEDKIMKFSFAGFAEALEKWGITLEELDFAIANEEF